MICPNCKTELPEGAAFCGSCGTKIEAAAQQAVPVQQAVPAQPAAPVQQAVPAQPAAEAAASVAVEAQPAAEAAQAVQGGEAAAPAAKSFDINALLKNKTVIIAAAAVLAVIVLAVLIGVVSSVAGGNPYKVNYNSIRTYYTDGETVLFQNGKEVDKTIDGEIDYGMYSSDRSVRAILAEDDTLYLVKGGKLTVISEDVKSFVMSDDGSTVAYVADDEISIFQGGKSKTVREVETSYPSLSLSPKGDVLCYSDTEDDDTMLYAYKGGKETELAKNCVPYYVADGGSIVYVNNIEKGKFGYIKNLKDDPEYLGELESIVCVSDDNKEVMFYTGSKTLYFAPGLKDTIQVSRDKVYFITPSNATSAGSLKNFIGESDGKIKRFKLKGGEFESFSIKSSDCTYKLSKDGKTMLYSSNGKLRLISTTKEDPKETDIDKDTYGFKASDDLKHIYYLDDDGNLVYSNGRKSKKIESDLDDNGKYKVDSNGMCVFIDDNDALEYSKNGSAKKKVKGMSDVSSVAVYGNIFFVNNDDVLYISNNGTSYKKTSVEF